MNNKAIISKAKYTGSQNEAALKAELIKVSKQNPTNAVLVGGQFGSFSIIVYKSLASIAVDSPESRGMIWSYGGVAFVNGKISQPTRGWQNKQIKIEKANCDH